MLNPNLYLNEKVFEENVEKAATRDGFGNAMMKLGETNNNVVALTADLMESCKLDTFAEKFPTRFFECGVAEQNMANIGAGLAISGKIPFITSFAVFSPGRNWEVIRTAAAYNNANIKIAGHHAGIATGPDGATHQATEDISLMRVLPNFSVFVPCDVIEAEKATEKAAKIKGPVYLRFSREKTPIITTKETPFEIGNMPLFWISENPKVVIFAMGHLVYQSLIAAKELEKEGIETLVVNTSIVKPLNKKAIIELAKETKAAVTVEDHQIAGGLGSAIAEVLAENLPTPIEFVGLRDIFAESGEAQDLFKKYKIDKNSIKEAVRKVISRK
ncbi:transketolase family protein [Patescibacteria group bacterium]|nr:transketolase family protein [Patescibacteria group bacterium]